MNIAIVGGGKASEIMINHFSKEKDLHIVGICDLSDTAPGIMRAKKLGIPTYKDMKEMVTRSNVNLVVELTGNEKVRQICLGLLRNDQDIMSAGGGRLMCTILDSITHNTIRIADELHNLTEQMINAMDIVDKTVINIKSILIKIQMIAINGNIEACKAGKNGAAFAVVAQHLGELVNEVDAAVEQIVNSSSEGHSVLNALKTTEKNLREEAQ